ncbi:MAG: hypothetical protein JW881_14515 [Spirochaetales bacterium]|nr:hypothetical protein [Spirochaetales bacterium]
MKRKRVFLKTVIVFVFLHGAAFPAAAGTFEEPVKQSVYFIPIHQCLEDEEYGYLAPRIYSIFSINLKNQAAIDLMTPETAASPLTLADYDLDGLIDALGDALHIDACIVGDYYVSGETLHISITVVDVLSGRIKNCYIERLPADLDMIAGIEEISRRIAFEIARDLPALSREALVQKHINSRLRKKIDAEEKLLDEIGHRRHEIQAAVFSGIHTGRTVVSWSNTRPLLSPPLYFEYSRYFDNFLHVRAAMEYLPFDLMTNDAGKYELGLGLLFGFHTESLFSFSFDAGLSLTYDDNEGSTALSDEKDAAEHVMRYSLSIPLQLGISWYLQPSFFLHIRLRWFGLTYTFEQLSPHDYDYGGRTLLYSNGFSPFSFLCMSLAVHAGMRF